VSTKPPLRKLRYTGVPGRQLKSPVTTTGPSSAASLRRINLLPFARAILLTWSRCVLRCRKERPVSENLRCTQLAERTTLVSQLAEYLSGVSLSQNPPESSNSRRLTWKKIALKLCAALLPYLGPRTWAYCGNLSRYVSRFPFCSS
jgi:hypothetical protein